MDGVGKFCAVIITVCLLLYTIVMMVSGNASDMVKSQLPYYDEEIKKITDHTLLRQDLMHFVCYNNKIMLIDGGGNNRVIINPEYWYGTVNRCENWKYVKPKLFNRIPRG